MKLCVTTLPERTRDVNDMKECSVGEVTYEKNILRGKDRM